MKLTVLDIVQDVLSDTSSDLINSIDDTDESLRVANLVRSTYLSLMSSMEWPHLRKLVNLVPYSNLNKPTHMKVKESITKIDNIRYNKAKVGDPRLRVEDVEYLEPEHFLHKTNKEDSTSDNVKIVQDGSGVIILIRNDRAPKYYTSFDDETIVFDSYDSEVDDTLVSSKFQAVAYLNPSFTVADDYIPDLPQNAFSMLVEEVKARASLRFRQIVDTKSEQSSQLQRSHLIKQSRRINRELKRPDYGRRRNRTVEPTFRRDQ